MTKEKWRTVVRVLMVIWAINGAGHMFLGLFDEYERASGRSDMQLFGGLIQVVAALSIFGILKRD